MFNVIRQGQRVAVWSLDGSVKLVDGPKWIFRFGKSVEKLKSFRANANQYLRVEHRDGHCDHLRGPASVWFNPVEHHTVSVHDAIDLDSNEAIVVYEHQDGKVSRQVKRGPGLFVPTENQWLHSFCWHGSEGGIDGRKVPHALSLDSPKARIVPRFTSFCNAPKQSSMFWISSFLDPPVGSYSQFLRNI